MVSHIEEGKLDESIKKYDAEGDFGPKREAVTGE
jgi:hypothetical protein